MIVRWARTLGLAMCALSVGACSPGGPASPDPRPTIYRLPTNPPIPQTTRIPGPSPAATGADSPLARVAFLSCFRNSADGPALDDVVRADPELVVWLGDNIYGDTEDMTVLRAKYEALGANPRFRALDAVPATMATWDDHDFGWDNANRTWPHREAAKEEFLRFWRASADDPRWDQPGVYSARTFGSGDRIVQVILLDNRFNLDPYDYAGTDPGRTILGSEQWAWLRERLSEPAAIRIIGSGIQVIQDYDIDEQWEGWGDSPLERERLFQLVRELGVPGVLFVSGDMHFAELTQHPDDALGYPTYDLTGSGLDQIETWAIGQWINPNRVGDLLNSDRKFGSIEIEWDVADPRIHLRIHDGARIHLDHVVNLSDLRPG